MNKKARTRKFSAKQSARLGAYLSAGVAASMAVSSEADAAIVFFNVNPSQTITAGESVSFGNINLGTGTYTLNSLTGLNFTILFSGAGTSLYNGAGGGSIDWGLNGSDGSGDVLKLSYGATINSAAALGWGYTYDYLTQGGSGPWTGGANAYAALRIDAGGGNYNYGWVSINYDTAGPTATISGFAFEDQINTAILAGDQGGPAAVPEPGTWATAALLMGGATYLGWRRRRDEAQKEAA
jgi:hypothetical protein